MKNTRRDFLWNSGGGFGGLVASQMLAADLSAGETGGTSEVDGLHHPAKVKRVIQLFMTGGASPMDNVRLQAGIKPTSRPETGTGRKTGRLHRDAGGDHEKPFQISTTRRIRSLGQQPVSGTGKRSRSNGFLMAMVSKTNVHGPATYMMNSGFLLPGFPSMGAWLSYGLGNLTDELPTFVVLPDARGLPYNQKGAFSSGFLPAVHQGTVINADGDSPIPDLFANNRYEFATRDADRDGFRLLQSLNQRHAADNPLDSRLDARIQSYELAAKMQMSAPEAFDVSAESATTQQAYGLDNKVTEDFGRRCLLARRLIERGTRFVQVWSGQQGATDNWDNHASIPKELPPIATSVDKPTAALLRDLKQRGLLEDTLLIWTTEFGRTPFAQGGEGRDHNGGSFVSWMAGAGIKPGVSYSKSDDWGYKAVEGKTYCYDFHATILHLLGVDHTRLVFRQNGIDRRLTDVHGHVVREILS